MVELFRLLSFAIWIIWLLTYWGSELLIKPDVRETLIKPKNSRLDRILVIMLGLAMIALFAFMLRVVLGVDDATDHLLLMLIGLICSVAGMFGSFLFRRAIGRFWRPITAIQPGHEVVDRGPYAVVRHPIYAAILLMYVGLVMVFSSVFTWLLFIIMVVGFALKAVDEERFLSAHLAPNYQNYRKRVRYRLIPGVW